MIKIGFFGGSFNPPTYAHINIAKTAIEKIKLDKFYFVPVGNLYNKPDLIDEKHRYEMLKIACNKEKNIYVEDIELNQSKNLSTIKAFNLIKEKYKHGVEIFYVMGADNFAKLPEWENAKDLIEKNKYIIFERNGYTIKNCFYANELLKNNKKNFKILTLDNYNNISSGIIRELIKTQQYEKCEKFTKPEIIKYIRKYELYK